MEYFKDTKRRAEKRNEKEKRGMGGNIPQHSVKEHIFSVSTNYFYQNKCIYMCVCVQIFWYIYTISCIAGLRHFYLYLIGQTCVYMYVYV